MSADHWADQQVGATDNASGSDYYAGRAYRRACPRLGRKCMSTYVPYIGYYPRERIPSFFECTTVKNMVHIHFFIEVLIVYRFKSIPSAHEVGAGPHCSLATGASAFAEGSWLNELGSNRTLAVFIHGNSKFLQYKCWSSGG